MLKCHIRIMMSYMVWTIDDSNNSIVQFRHYCYLYLLFIIIMKLVMSIACKNYFVIALNLIVDGLVYYGPINRGEISSNQQVRKLYVHLLFVYFIAIFNLMWMVIIFNQICHDKYLKLNERVFWFMFGLYYYTWF